MKTHKYLIIRGKNKLLFIYIEWKIIITHIVTIKYLVKGQRSKKGKIYKYLVKDKRKECT